MNVPRIVPIGGALLLLALCIAVVRSGGSGDDAGDPAPAEEPTPDLDDPSRGLAEMRALLLESGAEDFSIHPLGGVWGVLYEMGFENGAASVVSLADGTTSMYVSTGGGVIGAGRHEGVAQAAVALCEAAADHLDETEPAGEHPLPEDGRVRFTLLTTEGPRAADVSAGILEQGGHPLEVLHERGQAVLTEVRLASRGE